MTPAKIAWKLNSPKKNRFNANFTIIVPNNYERAKFEISIDATPFNPTVNLAAKSDFWSKALQ